MESMNELLHLLSNINIHALNIFGKLKIPCKKKNVQSTNINTMRKTWIKFILTFRSLACTISEQPLGAETVAEQRAAV